MKNHIQRVKIFVAGTDFYKSAGGVQHVNRELAAMLTEFSRSTPAHVEFFAYADEVAHGTPPRAGEHQKWHCCGGSKTRLVALLAQRLPRVSPHVVLFTHVSLLPLARLVRMLSGGSRITVVGHGAEVWERVGGLPGTELRRADAVVTPSCYTRDRLVDANSVVAEKISVIAHGLAHDWKSQESSAACRNSQILLSVARLSRDDLRYGSKGVEEVLRAMPHVQQRCPAATYWIAGDGDDRPRLEQLAATLGLRESVTFWGAVAPGDLRKMYSQAGMFVLPTTLEGFGIVFLEAMRHGLPVVAARAGATPEVVQDGVTGILIEPGDVPALASAISGLLLIPEERTRLGCAGQARVEDHFLFEHFARAWQRHIEALCPQAVYLARHQAVLGDAPSSPVLGSTQARS